MNIAIPIQQMGKKEGTPAADFQAEITLTIKAKCVSAPHMTTHISTFKYEDTSCTVEVNDKEIGRIHGCLGGVVELVDDTRHLSYWIKPDTLWEAFQKALQS